MQSLFRMRLARKRLKKEFEGFVARFVINEGHGRRARITVWKTIVERTVRKRKTQNVKEKSHGKVTKEETKETS